MILFFNKVWCERIERDNVQKNLEIMCQFFV
jgi:hypothetical protein